jgi:geranylgeranyl pyrophosphate synthase
MLNISLPAHIRSDLAQVEQLVQARTRTRAAVISIAGAYLPQPGDQQLRAMLVLLAADLGTYRSERVLHAAAAVELIHAATRTHNGMIDEAARRRRLPPGEPWNQGIALMVGDYLFALAAGEMALSPDPRVIGYYSAAVLAVSEAELLPVQTLVPLDAAYAQYRVRVGGVSAALLAAACRAGAACGGLAEAQIDQLAAYGEALGYALQINSEIQDFVAATPASPLAESLRRGRMSLPLIYAAQHSDAAQLSAALDSADAAAQRWAHAEVMAHGIAPARYECAAQVDAARTALADLPAGPARHLLESVATAVGSATS